MLLSRLLLKDYDTQTALFFGHRFKYFGGYMAGGSGYVLSKVAAPSISWSPGRPTDLRGGSEGEEGVYTLFLLETSASTATTFSSCFSSSSSQNP